MTDLLKLTAAITAALALSGCVIVVDGDDDDDDDDLDVSVAMVTPADEAE